MSLTGRRLRQWALLLPTLGLVAGSSGVVLEPWAVVLLLAVVGWLAVTTLVRGVRWTEQLAWLTALLLWASLDALLRPVWPRLAAASVAVGVVVLLLALVAQDLRVQAGAHPALVVGATVTAVWLLVERLALGSRPGGPFANPDLGATVALLGLAVLPNLAAPLALKLAAATATLAGILASGSRAAMLGVVVVGLASMLWQGSWRLRLGAAVLAGAAAVGFVVRLAVDQDPLRFERVRLWQVAVQTARAEFPWGCGPAGYLDAALPHNFPRGGEFAHYHRIPSEAEGDLLQLAATLGLPGVAIGLGLAWASWRVLRQSGVAGWGVAAAVATTAAFHSQLGFLAVAWPTTLAVVGCGRPRAGGRWRLSWGVAVASVVALLVPAAVALGVGGTRPVSPAARPAAAERLTAATLGSDAALADVEAAVWQECQARPRSAQALRTLGAVRLQRAELRHEAELLEAALAAFRQAQAVNPLDAWAALGTARACRLLGRLDAAEEALTTAVSLEPNFAVAWVDLARLHLERGDLEKSRRALGRAQLALARARSVHFVSEYERALVAVEPAALGRLRAAVGRP